MRRSLEVVLAVAVVVLGFLFAKSSMFTSFKPYDDEGYLLLSLTHYLREGGLYTKTFSQYGPFYFYAQQVLHALLGLPVTHDGGRILTLIFWCVSSLLGGVFVYRISRSLPLGSAAVLACVLLGRVLSNEPNHPQQIILALSMLAICVSLSVQQTPWMVLLLGAIGAALAFTKINAGVFFLVALAHALFCLLPAGWIRNLAMALSVAYALAAPPLLMRTHFSEWARGYCLWAILSTAAAFIFGSLTKPDRRLSVQTALMACAGLAGAAAALVITTLLQGVSPGTLLEGILIAPSRQPAAYWLPWNINAWQLLAAGVAVGIMWRFQLRQPKGLAMARCVAGITAIVLLLGFPRVGFSLAVPLLPLLILVPGTGPNPFSRIFIADLAVTQALSPYPVAGSQVALAAIPTLLCAFICISDGAKESTVRTLVPGTAFASLLIVVMGTGVFASGTRLVGYDDPPLDLPGARMVHLLPHQAARYRWLSDTVRANCEVLFTMPGMGSLNLWSNVPPPNGSNLTAWTTLFGPARQQAILDILQERPRACVVYNPSLLEFWSRTGAPAAAFSVLETYILAMPVAAQVDGYQIRISSARNSPFLRSITAPSTN
jgi:hypothetical protein